MKRSNASRWTDDVARRLSWAHPGADAARDAIECLAASGADYLTGWLALSITIPAILAENGYVLSRGRKAGVQRRADDALPGPWLAMQATALTAVFGADGAGPYVALRPRSRDEDGPSSYWYAVRYERGDAEPSDELLARWAAAIRDVTLRSMAHLAAGNAPEPDDLPLRRGILATPVSFERPADEEGPHG